MLLLDTNFLIDLHAELRRADGADGPAKRFMRANQDFERVPQLKRRDYFPTPRE